MQVLTPQQLAKLRKSLDVLDRTHNFFGWDWVPGRMPVCLYTARRAKRMVAVDATGKRIRCEGYVLDWHRVTVDATTHILIDDVIDALTEVDRG